MKLTKELLKDRFEEYNRLYFYGKLGTCKFGFLYKSQSNYGKYRDSVDKSGRIVSTIMLGKCIEWNEERLKSVLIHEMIHMYNRTVEGCKLDGLLGHGRRFRRQCRRLKRDYGIHIDIHGNYEYIDKTLSPKLWERVFLWLIDR